MRSATIGTIALGVLLAAVPSSAQVPAAIRGADFQLVGLSVGLDSAAVVRIMGQPDSVGLGDDPSQADLLPVWWYRDCAVVWLEKRVHGVWLLGPTRTTPRGISVGMSDALVAAAYGAPVNAQDRYYVYVSDRGESAVLLFFFRSYGRVDRIYAGRSID